MCGRGGGSNCLSSGCTHGVIMDEELLDLIETSRKENKSDVAATPASTNVVRADTRRAHQSFDARECEYVRSSKKH